MEPAQFLDSQFAEHLDAAAATRKAVGPSFAALAEACRAALAAGNKIVFCGNGGSAADAQHLAAELLVRYRVNRRALPAIALTTDSSTLTACANDFSYDDIFARQVEGLCRPGDIVLGISTSGNSPNVLKALEAAKRIGAVAVGFGGRDGGRMREVCDHLVVVPSNTVGRIQEMHILLGHALCEFIEAQLCEGTRAH